MRQRARALCTAFRNRHGYVKGCQMRIRVLRDLVPASVVVGQRRPRPSV